MREINGLIEKTIKYINQREKKDHPHHDIFSLTDYYIKLASMHYEKVKDPLSNARNFIKKLKILLQIYEKGKFTDYFKDFIKNEIDLEIALEQHEAHFDHVIQVFFLGFNIITKWNYLIKKYNNDNDETNFFFFRNFFFSWFTASLFHDHGYLIEKGKERIEKLKNALLKFGKFCYSFKLKKIRWETLHSLYHNLPKVSNLLLEQFKKLFWIENKGIWDHGLISANKYIEMLEEAKRDYLSSFKEVDSRNKNLLFLEWEPNQNSILAMLLHNFKMVKFENSTFNCTLNLSCSDERAIIPYILMICDDIQEWGREKLLNSLFQNDELDEILKYIKLIDCNFESTSATIKLRHELKNYEKKEHYENIFIEERLKKIKQKFPVEIQIYKNFNQNENTYCDNILIPLSHNNGYFIKVDHSIGKELFATIVYKL